MSSMNAALVHQIANLSNIPLSTNEEEKLAEGFVTTLNEVDKLMQANTENTNPTHQVTGLENVWREDRVGARSFTQTEALANATKTHNGYFVVPRILAE